MTEHDTSPEYQPQRELLEKLLKPQPVVIGIEGGPCSGKSTLAEQLKTADSNRQVVILPEAATQHILALEGQGISVNHIAQHDRPAYLAFERAVLETIVANIQEAKNIYADTGAIIVTDRCDIGAYLSDQEYRQLLSEAGLHEPPMLTMVDKLLYLPSVANVKPDTYKYLKATNPARLETTEIAKQVCAANLRAVSRHPELEVCWKMDFEKQLSLAANFVLNPNNETELKLRPTASLDDVHGFMSEEGEMINRQMISQSYHCFEGMIFRLRRTTTDHDETVYAFTVKTGEGMTRHELQRIITRAEYDILSACQQRGATLRKERTTYLIQEKNDRRQWVVDQYLNHGIPKWIVEVDVSDEIDAEKVWKRYFNEFRLTDRSAEALAGSLCESDE